MTGEPILMVSNLTRTFSTGGGMFGRGRGEVRAVDGINLSVPSGQTLALVGESGCGKTTVIKMILRLLRPTSGRILFKGRDIWQMNQTEVRGFRRAVQAVFQDPYASLNPHMLVRDIVAEPLVVLEGIAAAERWRRVDEVLEAVGLRSEHGRNYPHEFSGGQRQRIAIAAALISRPELIVLDEPVSALDVSIRAQIMNLFKEIQERFGVSYLVVAHDLGTTRFLAEKVAVMYLGRIVESGPADLILSQPRHPYAEALLSAAIRPDPDAPDTEIVPQGEPPSPLAPPPGCAFHPRCHRRLDRLCDTVSPPLAATDAGEWMVACHLVTAGEGASVRPPSAE